MSFTEQATFSSPNGELIKKNFKFALKCIRSLVNGNVEAVNVFLTERLQAVLSEEAFTELQESLFDIPKRPAIERPRRPTPKGLSREEYGVELKKYVLVEKAAYQKALIEATSVEQVIAERLLNCDKLFTTLVEKTAKVEDHPQWLMEPLSSIPEDSYETIAKMRRRVAFILKERE